MIGDTNASMKKVNPKFATIEVTTNESTLIGTTCTLSFGGSIIKSAVFDTSGNCSFTGIVDVGTYTVDASDGTTSETESVIITTSNIIAGNTIGIIIEFGIPLPVASLGEVKIIGGYNCMCIGTNRYIYMYNIGTQNWNSAMSAAQNWSVPTGISSLYNVNSKALMIKDEADTLTSAQIKSLISAAGGNNVVWLGSERTSTDAYLLYNGKVDYGNNNKGHTATTLPAFTISRK